MTNVKGECYKGRELAESMFNQPGEWLGKVGGDSSNTMSRKKLSFIIFQNIR